MNPYKVQLCNTCCGIKKGKHIDPDCTHNDGSFPEHACGICEESYESQSAATRCCYDFVDKTVMDSRHLAKEAKKKAKTLDPDNESLYGEDECK